LKVKGLGLAYKVAANSGFAASAGLKISGTEKAITETKHFIISIVLN